MPLLLRLLQNRVESLQNYESHMDPDCDQGSDGFNPTKSQYGPYIPCQNSSLVVNSKSDSSCN